MKPSWNFRILFAIACIAFVTGLKAAPPRVFPIGTLPEDDRLKNLKTLDGEFPFTSVSSLEEWKSRAERLRRQVLFAAGLWPEPVKAPLNPHIYGRVERDDYTVDKVYFESLPGHYVTGNLYRPKNPQGSSQLLPAVLCPHGHWDNGRFNDQGEKQAHLDLSIGAERWENAARHHLQARCVQLARMGCIVFHYDMLGYADSIQFTAHHPDFPYEEAAAKIAPDMFFSADSDARLETMFGLQTWNSIRSVDFLLSLPDVDPKRIAVTGASGGGTQSMILSAVDERVAASIPCAMVSTAMQGGCSCENAPYLRIGMGNIDIAGLTAPRPLALIAANDWTKELQTKGYPDLLALYSLFGCRDRFTATFNIHFEHNYNQVSRCTMYGFLNRHFNLGFEEPVLERDFKPLTIAEMSVWDANHPKPAGESIGRAHERLVRKWWTSDSEACLNTLISPDHVDLKKLHDIVGGAWAMMIGRNLPESSSITLKRVVEKKHESYSQLSGVVRNSTASEELPVILLKPNSSTSDNEIVLWISSQGKSALFDTSGQPTSSIRSILASNRTVLAADLFGQGEFTEDGKPWTENRMNFGFDGKQAWEHYSGFTYGYNSPLFVQRVHDLMSLVVYAKNLGAKRISLVGLDGAGPWVAATRAHVGSAIDRVAIDTAGFRFADIKSQRDANFVPGSIKYGDLSALLALSAPYPLWLAGMDAAESNLVRFAYRTADAENELTLAGKVHDPTELVLQWLLHD